MNDLATTLLDADGEPHCRACGEKMSRHDEARLALCREAMK